METNFVHLDFGNGVYAISAPQKEQIYLVCGEKYAAVIDTGMGIGSLRTYIEKLTDLPLMVINTHGHPDHAGGNAEFSDCPLFMRDEDIPIYHIMCAKSYRANDVKMMNGDKAQVLIDMMVEGFPETKHIEDGFIFDLGNRSLRTIHTPGHTSGSICLFDDKTGYLFVGDMLTYYDTWMFLDHCESLSTYRDSLKKLMNLKLPIIHLFAGHLPIPVTSNLINLKLSCVKEILNQPHIGVPITTFAGKGLRHVYQGISIIYNPDHL